MERNDKLYQALAPLSLSCPTAHSSCLGTLSLASQRDPSETPSQEPNNNNQHSSMALIHLLSSPWALLAAPVLVAFYFLYPYFVTYRDLRGIPAPFPAQFSNLWLLSVCRQGRRYEIVDQMHKKLGPLVRIQPNHVSVADDDAIQAIYGHGNGFLKAYVQPLNHLHPSYLPTYLGTYLP